MNRPPDHITHSRQVSAASAEAQLAASVDAIARSEALLARSRARHDLLRERLERNVGRRSGDESPPTWGDAEPPTL